jgi:hypothetical protein
VFDAIGFRAALIALAVAVVLAIVFGFSAHHYKGKLATANDTITTLRGDIKRGNDEATERLKTLTRDRDDKQARLNRLAANQEKADDAAKSEIARLRGGLVRAGVRVRIVPGACGAGGDSAAGQAAGTAQTGQRDAGTGTGLLPAGNTERLAGVIQEIETMSAAYASCRARLVATP